MQRRLERGDPAQGEVAKCCCPDRILWPFRFGMRSRRRWKSAVTGSRGVVRLRPIWTLRRADLAACIMCLWLHPTPATADPIPRRGAP